MEIQAAESSGVTASASADSRSSRSAIVRTTDRRNLLTAACLSADSSDCSTRSSVERSRSMSFGSFTTTWMQGCIGVLPDRGGAGECLVLRASTEMGAIL